MAAENSNTATAAGAPATPDNLFVGAVLVKNPGWLDEWGEKDIHPPGGDARGTVRAWSDATGQVHGNPTPGSSDKNQLKWGELVVLDWHSDSGDDVSGRQTQAYRVGFGGEYWLVFSEHQTTSKEEQEAAAHAAAEKPAHPSRKDSHGSAAEHQGTKRDSSAVVTVEPTPQTHGRRAETPAGTSTHKPVFTPESLRRLVTPPLHHSNPAKLPPLIERRALTPSQEKQSIQRLSEDSIIKKKQQLEKLDRRVYGAPEGEGRLVLDKEGTDNIVFRMYQQGVKDNNDRLKRLRQRYLSTYEKQVKTKRYTDKAHQEAVLDRLFNTKSKDQERSQELFERHNPKKQVLRRSKEERAANEKRYFEGGFGKKH